MLEKILESEVDQHPFKLQRVTKAEDVRNLLQALRSGMMMYSTGLNGRKTVKDAKIKLKGCSSDMMAGKLSFRKALEVASLTSISVRLTKLGSFNGFGVTTVTW
ncbi:unnamed protein product [Acanthoscelides obtectus]|uniref:Uncharacterized protein n=1 Tax=Acanthoscelides obtectus TaxID=200917 RepID=A0A9P0LLQ4_ACAOB|nr:unnamed protein product [Acanthoscelides obtectus]CAK1658154.1 hypothetical protein AOBTE_LOCUS20731 [Acanthoscelides obtectus]